MNTMRPSPSDRTRINKNRPYELQYWSKKFNMTPDKLRAVIDRAGTDQVKAIEKFLIKNT